MGGRRPGCQKMSPNFQFHGTRNEIGHKAGVMSWGWTHGAPQGSTVVMGARYGVWVGDKRGGGSRGAARISSSDMVWVSTYPPSGICEKKQFGDIYS